jgi:hypothetical protein
VDYSQEPDTTSSVGSGSWSFAASTVVPVKTCDFCGRTEEDDAKTLTWTTAVENGRRRTFCESCSRQHLRAMEGKLDSEWW